MKESDKLRFRKCYFCKSTVFSKSSPRSGRCVESVGLSGTHCVDHKYISYSSLGFTSIIKRWFSLFYYSNILGRYV